MVLRGNRNNANSHYCYSLRVGAVHSSGDWKLARTCVFLSPVGTHTPDLLLPSVRILGMLLRVSISDQDTEQASKQIIIVALTLTLQLSLWIS